MRACLSESSSAWIAKTDSDDAAQMHLLEHVFKRLLQALDGLDALPDEETEWST